MKRAPHVSDLVTGGQDTIALRVPANELAQAKGEAYRRGRVGQAAELVVEADGFGLSEDYLHVRLTGDASRRVGDLLYAPLGWDPLESGGGLVANA